VVVTGAPPPVRVYHAAVPTDVLESLRTARGWINYNPGPPFDFLAGAHPTTEEQLAVELKRLHDSGFLGLVTNTMAFGLERAPQIAKDCGFEYVVAKLWWQNDELLATEKANLDAAVDAVDAVCVGNEIIQKGIADHDRLVREVDEARDRFGIPITTGFQPPDWQSYPDLATSIGDFSFLNVHPWWVLHRNDPLTAANWVAEAYELVAATPGMPAGRVVAVQETSFPSGALPPEATPGASPENQMRFYEALLATDVPFVWFHGVDSPMHRRVSPPGGFGGLWDENWEPKPVVGLLASAL
jgi:exo-beta-1,3-glucanase (GH17 family)